ncbi:Extradiol ring-cleavage dioxygenase, class III enzyme, subunit B [Cladochytrium replicatum]|nr:Extradiol ring-cleavage dioxygenase, class III enzyme, subunit B [Cladochytrium replicatum]
MTRAPALFLPHGGGPMPLLGDPNHKGLNDFLGTTANKILTGARPRAIVLVTAHWEEDVVHISSAPKHNLLYDYYGFPPEAYKLRYDAPGEPEVAREVQKLLESAGIPTQLDDKRGWDHGVFIPLSLALPAKDIPIVQVSVLSSLDPVVHVAMGRALAPLRDANVAIVGSGMTFHNMGAFRPMFARPGGAFALDSGSVAFDEALSKVCAIKDPEERAKALEGWAKLPSARYSHPREEHLLPLIVIAAAGGDSEPSKLLEWNFGPFRVSSFAYGASL